MIFPNTYIIIMVFFHFFVYCLEKLSFYCVTDVPLYNLNSVFKKTKNNIEKKNARL